MHVGLGIPGNRLSQDNVRFACQAGATRLMVSLRGVGNDDTDNLPDNDPRGTGYSEPRPELWSVDGLTELREMIEREGLRLEAIENFEPADWYDVLLDGPRRESQIAHLQQIIRNLGTAEIPIMGYNFSLAGVWGRVQRPVARGGALAPVFDSPEEPPIPHGMIWNSVYDRAAFELKAETVGNISDDELWRRFELFLDEMLPVAEEAGVKLALHPDDPPAPTLRGTPRLVHRPELYDRVLAHRSSPNNCLEFCIGTLSEMPDSDIYGVVDHYSRTGRIAYAHMRNVAGKMPYYEERFIDEGDTDMIKVISILGKNGYDGMVIPDHVPAMLCDAPWHAGVAHSLGWMTAAMKTQGLLS